jgi:WD40 repeat protein
MGRFYSGKWIITLKPTLEPGRKDWGSTARTQLVRSIAFSPNGLLVAAGGVTYGNEKAIMWLWDAITGKEIRRFSPHVNDVATVAFSPDGRSIASGAGGELSFGPEISFAY